MTQLLEARSGKIPSEMEFVAQREHLAADVIRREVAEGRMVIPANKAHLDCHLEHVSERINYFDTFLSPL